jgi:hypothetical protein
VPPAHGCPQTGPSSPEVTRAICLVPSAPFAQAPRYALPVHLCRFRVRSTRGLFPGSLTQHRQSSKAIQRFDFVTTRWPRTINLVPIDYGFRPRLRGRLTLRGLALRRNPWTFGARVSHTRVATHVSILTSDTSSGPHGSAFTGLRNAPLPRDTNLRWRHIRSFGAWLEPRYIFGAGWLLDQ